MMSRALGLLVTLGCLLPAAAGAAIVDKNGLKITSRLRLDLNYTF